MESQGPVRAFLHRATASPWGWMEALVALVAVAAVNAAFWWPLQYPPRWIGELVGIVAPTSCSQYAFDTWQYAVCGWGLAAFALSGTFIVAALLFAFRKAIRRGLYRLAKLLPAESKFLWAPVVATLVFTMAWASIPFHGFTRPGVVWDGFFPTVIGFLTWALLRYRRPVFRRMPRLLAWRDRIPEIGKYAIAFGVVIAAAWAATEYLTPLPLFEKRWWELYPPQRDQILAVLSLLVTFALWAPRVRLTRKAEGSS